MNFHELKRFLLSIVYPNRCPFCGNVIYAHEYFCDGCNSCDVYSNDGNSDDVFYCIYNDKSKPILAKAKEQADGYAICVLAKLLCHTLAKHDNNILAKVDVIAAVPARKASLKKRGYSLPVLLAKEIADISGKSYSKDLLRLLRETDEQKGLSAVQRAENLSGAFAVSAKAAGKIPSNSIVLVIDDISTTGATLRAAKSAIADSPDFSGKVYGAAVAKTSFESADTTPSQPPQP